MGKINYILFFILIGILSCSRTSHETAFNIINEVKSEHAPDSRTVIFDIEASGNNPVLLTGETDLKNIKETIAMSLKEKGIEFIDEIVVLPSENVGAKKFALINVSVANLRSKPEHRAELVTQALLGTPVKILKMVNGWYLIQTPDKYIAWTNGGSLETLDQGQLNEWKEESKVIYLNTYGFSRTINGMERISDLVAGNILIIEEDLESNWSVSYPDGRKAIIPKTEAFELKAWNENHKVTEKSISSAAKNLVGIPYLWGGTSVKGLDCSGFTKTVYFLNGYVLPRDASQQVYVGELIDERKEFSALKIGDLLFFGRKNADQSERVIHVGLWLGNNQFIHASGDVHISSMDSMSENFDRYNFDRYLRATRIMGSNSGLEGILAQEYLIP